MAKTRPKDIRNLLMEFCELNQVPLSALRASTNLITLYTVHNEGLSWADLERRLNEEKEVLKKGWADWEMLCKNGEDHV